MKGFILLSVCLMILCVICYFWIRGIDNMKNNHPDYKGEDLLDDDEINENELD
jgi:nitrogen fixation-related uncharacterized protein